MSISGSSTHKQNFDNCSVEEEDWKFVPEFKIEETLSDLDSFMRFEDDESRTILIEHLGVTQSLDVLFQHIFCLRSRNLHKTHG